MSHALGALRELHLATVTSEEVDERGRIDVTLVATGLALKAPCLTLGAGSKYGVSCLPRQDEVVVVAFVGPDEDNAIVLGAVWAGNDSHPSDAQPGQKHYAMRTKAGCQLRLSDTDTKEVKIETPGGAHVLISDSGGTETITLQRGDDTMTMDSGGITIQSQSSVTIDGQDVTISAGVLTVNADASNFSGLVKCENAVASSNVTTGSYTPAAGGLM